jgi:hypothetical protein
MATASVSITVPTPADQVWNLIGGFDSLPDWLPYIPRSTLSEGGRVRHLANPDGDAIVERLEAFDQAGRSYTYSILQAPFPVTGYRSTLRVVEQGTVRGSTGPVSSLRWASATKKRPRCSRASIAMA